MKLIRISIAFGAWLTLTHAECFFPGRTPANRDVPCNSGPGPSACCSEDATCLSNGACLNGGRLSRGSCTDINWESTACFKGCVDFNRYGGSDIIPCPSNTGEWLFACGLGNCSVSSARFTMSYTAANQFVLRPTQLSSAVSAAGSSLVAVSTSAIDSSPTPTSESEDDTDTYTAGAMAGVGVGIGVPLLIVIGVLTWLLLREKKKHRPGIAHDGSNYSTLGQGSPQPLATEHMPSHMYASLSVQPPVSTAEMAVKTASQELEAGAR